MARPTKAVKSTAKKNAPVKNIAEGAKKSTAEKKESIMQPELKTRILAKYKKLIDDGSNAAIAESKLVDTQEFSSEEIAELMVELNDYVPGATGVASSKKTTAAKSPNDALDLTKFDYRDLKGQSFKDYVALVGDHEFRENRDGEYFGINGKLKTTDQYDFDLYAVKPIRKDRFPGMENSPKDYVGLTLVKDVPVHTTRIPVSVALEYNRQILNQHSVAGHGKYYLLKK